MQLCERKTALGGHQFREIRCLTQTNYQTPVVTTHPSLPMAIVAGAIFSRWTQENFFKYMVSDYSFKHIISYGTELIVEKKVNRKRNYQNFNGMAVYETEVLPELPESGAAEQQPVRDNPAKILLFII